MQKTKKEIGKLADRIFDNIKTLAEVEADRAFFTPLAKNGTGPADIERETTVRAVKKCRLCVSASGSIGRLPAWDKKTLYNMLTRMNPGIVSSFFVCSVRDVIASGMLADEQRESLYTMTVDWMYFTDFTPDILFPDTFRVMRNAETGKVSWVNIDASVNAVMPPLWTIGTFFVPENRISMPKWDFGACWKTSLDGRIRLVPPSGRDEWFLWRKFSTALKNISLWTRISESASFVVSEEEAGIEWISHMILSSLLGEEKLGAIVKELRAEMNMTESLDSILEGGNTRRAEIKRLMSEDEASALFKSLLFISEAAAVNKNTVSRPLFLDPGEIPNSAFLLTYGGHKLDRILKSCGCGDRSSYKKIRTEKGKTKQKETAPGAYRQLNSSPEEFKKNIRLYVYDS